MDTLALGAVDALLRRRARRDRAVAALRRDAARPGTASTTRCCSGRSPAWSCSRRRREPDHALHRPRAALDPALRAVRDRPAPAHLARGRAEVPGGRVGGLGDAALRAGARSTAPPGRWSSTASPRAIGTRHRGRRRDPLLLTGIALCATGLAFKASVAPVPPVDAGRLPGRPHADHHLHGGGHQGGRVRGVPAPVRPRASGSAQLDWGPALAVLAAVTIVVGNVGAIAAALAQAACSPGRAWRRPATCSPAWSWAPSSASRPPRSTSPSTC